MITLRAAEERDVARLAELMNLSGVAVSGIRYDGWSGVVVVAEDGDEVIGFVQFLVGYPYSHLTEMAVHPDHRGKGVGHTLLGAMEMMLDSYGSQGWTTLTSKDRIADALHDWGATCTGTGYGFVRIFEHGNR